MSTEAPVLPALPELDLAAVPDLFQVGDGGRVRVTGTRVPIERIVYFHSQGLAPEGIVGDFPGLALCDVYSVIGYYHRHRARVDEYIAELERQAGVLRAALEQPMPESIGARVEELRAAIRSAAD